MLEDGLSYPTQGDKWIGRFTIGAILTFLSFLIIPAILIMGYFIRVLNHTIENDPKPPAWEDWGDMFVDGIKATVVTFVYAIVPFAVFGGLATVLFGAGAAAGDSGGGLIAGFGILTFLMAIPAMFIIYYFLPAALGSMAREGTLSAAFDLSVLKQVALSADYLIAVLLPIVVGLVVNFVTTFLAITVIGLLLVPFVSFWSYLAIFRMFGTAFRETSNKTASENTVPAATA